MSLITVHTSNLLHGAYTMNTQDHVKTIYMNDLISVDTPVPNLLLFQMYALSPPPPPTPHTHIQTQNKQKSSKISWTDRHTVFTLGLFGFMFFRKPSFPFVMHLKLFVPPPPARSVYLSSSPPPPLVTTEAAWSCTHTLSLAHSL